MRKGIRETKQDRIFNGINMVFMILIFIIFAWPLWFVVVASFSDPNAVTSGQVWLWPVDFHTGGYVMTFENTEIWRGYLNSIFYTILGTAVNMVLTVITAYPLSRMDFMRRNGSYLFTGTGSGLNQYDLGDDHSRSDFHLQCTVAQKLLPVWDS